MKNQLQGMTFSELQSFCSSLLQESQTIRVNGGSTFLVAHEIQQVLARMEELVA